MSLWHQHHSDTRSSKTGIWSKTGFWRTKLRLEGWTPEKDLSRQLAKINTCKNKRKRREKQIMNSFSRHAILNLSPDMHLKKKKAVVFWTIASLKTNLILLLIYLDSNNWHSEISLLSWTLKKTNTKVNCISAYYHRCKTCNPLPGCWLSALRVTEIQSTAETSFFLKAWMFFSNTNFNKHEKNAYCGLCIPNSRSFSFLCSWKKVKYFRLKCLYIEGFTAIPSNCKSACHFKRF